MLKTIIKKIGSRKFQVCLVMVISGLLGMFGISDNTIEFVSSLILAASGGIVYVLVEGRIDAKAVEAVDVAGILKLVEKMLKDKDSEEDTSKDKE